MYAGRVGEKVGLTYQVSRPNEETTDMCSQDSYV